MDSLDSGSSGLIHSPRREGGGRLERRAKIGALEAAMRAMPDEIVDLPVRHHFAPGSYVRELRLAAGVTAVGKIHATENIFILVSGDLLVETEGGAELLSGYTVLTTKPGDKRAVHALTDCIVLNVHPNVDDCRDLAVLEQRFIAPDYDALDASSAPALEGAV